MHRAWGRLRGTLVAVVVTAVAAAGCGAPRADWRAPSGGAASSPGASGSPAEPADGVVRWRNCASEAKAVLGVTPRNFAFDCGTVPVPRDWNTAENGKAVDGRTFDIALIRARSTRQTDRIGSLLINPGGPGASGVDYSVYLSTLAPDVAARFDIIGFDPRGVERSATVDCFADADLDASFGYEPDPATLAAFSGAVDISRRLVTACATKYGEDLRLYSTEQAARDMDAIRAAVGDDKLSYLGYSYGTLLGAVYAQLYPRNIRAMVLDGAVDPTESPIEATEGQARGFERAFGNFAEWCRGNASDCPIGPDARATVTALLNSARTGPVAGQGRSATAGWVFTAIVSSLYSRETWEKLATSLDELRQGKPDGIFQLADAYADRDASGRYSNLFDANATINCTDSDKYPAVEQIRTLQAQWRAKYPLFGAPLAVGLLGCALWPGKHDPYPVGQAVGAPPIVVVGTTGDPATPYESTAKLARMLGVGTVLTWEGEGHTAYPETTCIRRAVNGYLIDLKVPAPNLTCPAS